MQTKSKLKELRKNNHITSSDIIVYSITSRDVVYYGSTKRSTARLSDELGLLKRGKHTNAILQQAYNTYQDVTLDVLFVTTDVDQARRIEQQNIINSQRCANYYHNRNRVRRSPLCK